MTFLREEHYVNTPVKCGFTALMLRANPLEGRIGNQTSRKRERRVNERIDQSLGKKTVS